MRGLFCRMSRIRNKWELVQILPQVLTYDKAFLNVRNARPPSMVRILLKTRPPVTNVFSTILSWGENCKYQLLCISITNVCSYLAVIRWAVTRMVKDHTIGNKSITQHTTVLLQVKNKFHFAKQFVLNITVTCPCRAPSEMLHIPDRYMKPGHSAYEAGMPP